MLSSISKVLQRKTQVVHGVCVQLVAILVPILAASSETDAEINLILNASLTQHIVNNMSIEIASIRQSVQDSMPELAGRMKHISIPKALFRTLVHDLGKVLNAIAGVFSAIWNGKKPSFTNPLKNNILATISNLKNEILRMCSLHRCNQGLYETLEYVCETYGPSKALQSMRFVLLALSKQIVPRSAQRSDFVDGVLAKWQDVSDDIQAATNTKNIMSSGPVPLHISYTNIPPSSTRPISLSMIGDLDRFAQGKVHQTTGPRSISTHADDASSSTSQSSPANSRSSSPSPSVSLSSSSRSRSSSPSVAASSSQTSLFSSPQSFTPYAHWNAS